MLIGLSGKAGAGKDTVADFLTKSHRFTKVAMADPMKRFCMDVFGFSFDQCWGPSESRNAPDPRYLRGLVPRTHLSPRYALQKLGSEWGRDCYEDVWVDYAIGMAKVLLNAPASTSYSPERGLRTHLTAKGASTITRGVVVPDCRFQNEFKAIKQAGGTLVRIVRPAAGLNGTAGAHVSETEQDGVPDAAFDFVIRNTGTLEDLAFMTEAIIHQLGGGEILDVSP